MGTDGDNGGQCIGRDAYKPLDDKTQTTAQIVILQTAAHQQKVIIKEGNAAEECVESD